MGGRIEIHAGVAATGKTTRLLHEYRAALDDAHRKQKPGTTLWLSPTNRARRAVLSRLIGPETRVCFAPNVLTFEAFAERVLQASPESTSRISQVARRMLVRNIIDRCHRDGQLTYFQSIAGTSGFLDLVIGFISELKRDETWPEHFAKACQKRGERPKDRELSLIYTEYQRRLQSLSVYDAEGRFWSARNVLAAGQRKPFEELSLVVVDGFADFTHTQYEILGHLAGYCGRTLISLPLETPPVRRDLFAKSEAARQRIQQVASKIGADVRVSEHRRQPGSQLPAFEQIADSLFDNPRTVARSSQASGIEIVAATGQTGEIEALAERVKRLLLDGVPPADIVVAFRNLDDYSDIVGEAFRESGIPAWCSAGQTLDRIGPLRALSAVLHLEMDDWPFDRLMAVLDSNYVRPAWEEWTDEAVRNTAAQLRRRALYSDRQQILSELRRASQRAAEVAKRNADENVEDENLAAARRNLDGVFALLDRLSRATSRLRTKSDSKGWAEILLELARELGIPGDTAPTAISQTTNPESKPSVRRPTENDSAIDHRDRRAWDVFERILFESSKADALDDTSESLGLSDCIARLTDLLRREQIPPAGSGAGCVLILDASEVRSLDVPYLFLGGLNESSFPHMKRDDCIYSESERRTLNEQGLTLGHRSSHSQDEMLLFYQVITRARRRLTLSYPAVSANGQPLFPSPYVNVVRDLFDPEALEVIPAGKLDPVPAADRILSDADLRLVAADAVSNHEPSLFRAMLGQAELTPTAGSILAAARAAGQRFHHQGFTPHEGMIHSAESIARLRQHFGAEYEFNATQLESYAQCPFRFFLQDILKVRPLELPEMATDYRGRGQLIHEVLAVLHHDAASDEKAAVASVDELIGRLRGLIVDRMKVHADSQPLQQALAKIEQAVLEEWGTSYGNQLGKYYADFTSLWDEQPVPARFEVAFGKVRERGPQTAEPKWECLTLGSGEKITRICGRIDRIDVGRESGRLVFNVIDYKSGGANRFALEDIQRGHALQLALYTIAVERLDIAGENATPFQMGFWKLKENGFVTGVSSKKRNMWGLEPEFLESLEQALEEIAPKLAEGIRGGAFPVINPDKDCSRTCAYSSVCRVAQVRALPESLEKHWEP